MTDDRWRWTHTHEITFDPFPSHVPAVQDIPNGIWHCQFCGYPRQSGLLQCPGCGAPRLLGKGDVLNEPQR